MFKLKNSKLIALFFATAFVLNACGSKEIKQENIGVEADTSVVEKAEAEEKNDNKIDSNADENQEVSNSIEEDDFNDFVEVSFKHKDYPSTEDGKPDYSGVYCLDTYSTTYGCCNLIKQEDGYYHCYLYEYRCFIYETKAKYKSDNVLEIVDDEISGTIKVNDYDVDVSFVESNGNKVDISYTNVKYE